MSAKICKIQIQVEMRWWTRYVLFGCCLFWWLVGAEPNERVLDWIGKYGFRYVGKAG